MTLQNGLIHQGRAYLWTDTAAWNPETREEVGHVCKAFQGTMWPWAAVHSGLMPLDEPNIVARRVSEEMPLTGEALLNAATKALHAEKAEGRHGRLLIAYPCSQFGARLFLISTEHEPFMPAFTPYETVEFMSSGNGADFAAEFAGKDMNPADMRRFIDGQLAHPCEKLVGGSFVGLGGEIVEIEVTAAGVESRVVRAVEPAERVDSVT